MKSIFKSKIVLFMIIFLMLFSTLCMASDIAPISSSTSNEVSNTENSIDETYEFIESDVYKFDKDITIDSIVDGNVFVFGNNITISGEVGGDVFAFGDNVTVTDQAYIHGNIFVFGNRITINGICYDVYAAGESFTLESKAIISRDLRLAATRTNISGQIRRDAYLSTDELVFPDDAKDLIKGNLSYTSVSEFAISDAIVGGNITYTPEVSNEKTVVKTITSYITDILSTLLYSLAIILLTIWIAPNFKEKATKIFKKRSPLSLGVGLLTSLAIIIGSFVLIFITNGLGVGISAAAVTIYVLALTIAKTVFGMASAKLIADKLNQKNNIMFVVISLIAILVISLLELIPFVGGLFGFVITMIGLGIIVLNLISKKDLDDKTEVVTEKE